MRVEALYPPPLDKIYDFTVITMVKDDYFFLQIWIEYYMRTLDPHFVIIDHFSTITVKDWLADNYPNLNATIINLPNIKFDDTFKSITLSSIANIYSSCSKFVIPSDVDEIVIPNVNNSKNLFDYLLSIELDHVAPIGVEFIHRNTIEPKYNYRADVTSQRDIFYFSSGYSKPIIWKKPSFFSAGQHGINEPYCFDENILLAHLRFADYDNSIERQSIRNKINFSDLQKNKGAHWKVGIDKTNWIGNWIYKKAISTIEKKDTREGLENFMNLIGKPQKAPSGFYKHDISITTDFYFFANK